jgi:hypothetical protein
LGGDLPLLCIRGGGLRARPYHVLSTLGCDDGMVPWRDRWVGAVLMLLVGGQAG